MLGFINSVSATRNDYAACNGCGLCLLVCPVWRMTRDLRFTPHGRAKALQHGVGIGDIAASVESCTLCAACEPVCPERIDLVGMIVDLRRELRASSAVQSAHDQMDQETAHPAERRAASPNALLLGPALRARQATLARVASVLDGAICADDGADIALALETGIAVSPQRLARFLAPLRGSKKIIAADGLLLRHLRNWLPKSNIVSLGEALSRLAAVRRNLRASDLYVIEPRAYHSDYQRLVKYYDRLRMATDCVTNLDLLRTAIPATARSLPQRLGLTPVDDSAHVRWILRGRNVTRIVVESVEDLAAFESVTGCAVVHLADLTDDVRIPMGRHS